MTGEQAFDELVREGYLEITPETGWARVVKAPTLGSGPRGRRELDWFVKRVKTLGAYSVATHEPGPIEVTASAYNDEVMFRKRKDP